VGIPVDIFQFIAEAAKSGVKTEFQGTRRVVQTSLTRSIHIRCFSRSLREQHDGLNILSHHDLETVPRRWGEELSQKMASFLSAVILPFITLLLKEPPFLPGASFIKPKQCHIVSNHIPPAPQPERYRFP